MGLRVEPLYQRLGGLVCFSRLRSRFMGLIFFIVGSYEENLFYTGFYIFFTQIDFCRTRMWRNVGSTGLRNELLLIRLLSKI